MAKGDTVKAEATLEEAVAMFPTDPNVIGSLVNHYMTVGKSEKAVENLQEKTGINFDKEKNFAAKIFQLARDRADGGVAEKALDDFTRTVEKYADTKGLSGLDKALPIISISFLIR